VRIGVNFINVLCRAFKPRFLECSKALDLSAQIPKVQKDSDDLTIIFALSGSARVKASRKILVKLTPAVNFINIRFAQLFPYYSLALNFFWQKNMGAKADCKTLVKLTAGVNFINILCALFLYESAFFAKT